MQRDTSTSHRVDQAVLGTLDFNGCAKLQDIGRNWNTLSYRSMQSITCLVSIQAMEELGHFQLPGIVYRSKRHGAVDYHAATWGDGGG
jgi:hypothetical protein